MNATSAQAQAEAALVQTVLQSLGPTMGATLMGSYLSSIFYGVTLLQTYLYFTRYYKRDSIYLCSLVIILTLLDTFALVSAMHSIWFNVIQNFANPLAVFTVDWGVASSVITTAVMGFIVQSFYAYRAYVLSGRKIWIPAIILVFGLAGLVLMLIFMSLLIKKGSFIYIDSFTSLTTSSLVCSIVSDIVITTTITRYLLQGRQKEFRRTEVLIRKLVLYTINTGIVTILCTVMALILSEVRTNNLYDLVFYYLLSKCYVNSMLAFLNARESLRKGDNVVSFHLGDTSASKPKFRGMSESEAFSEESAGKTPDIRNASATVVHGDSKVNLPTGFADITINTITTHEP